MLNKYNKVLQRENNTRISEDVCASMTNIRFPLLIFRNFYSVAHLCLETHRQTNVQDPYSDLRVQTTGSRRTHPHMEKKEKGRESSIYLKDFLSSFSFLIQLSSKSGLGVCLNKFWSFFSSAINGAHKLRVNFTGHFAVFVSLCPIVWCWS